MNNGLHDIDDADDVDDPLTNTSSDDHGRLLNCAPVANSPNRHGNVADDFSDIISSTIRNRTKRIGLCSALSLATCMALLSVLLAVAFTVNRYEAKILGEHPDMTLRSTNRTAMPRQHFAATTNNSVTAMESSSTSCLYSSSFIMTIGSSSFNDKPRVPLWSQLLTFQIELLQNLIHASLLGGAAIVVAYRGDVVWLYFVRNCGFFFGMVALSYLMIDVQSALDGYYSNMVASDSTTSTTAFTSRSHYHFFITTTLASTLSVRIMLAILFATSAGIVYCYFDAVVRRVRKLQHQHLRTVITLPSSASRTDCNCFPPYMAETLLDYQRANIIYYTTVAIQLVSVIYRIWTTWHGMRINNNLETNYHSFCQTNMTSTTITEVIGGDHPLRTTNSTNTILSSSLTQSILSFEMAYGMGAHEAFLLALMMLPSTFPRDPASIGGATLVSGWRLIMAVGNLIHVAVHWGESTNVRDLWSAFITSLEGICVLPILITALLLAKNVYWSSRNVSFPRILRKSKATYSRLDASEINEEEDEDDIMDSDFPNKISSHDAISPPVHRIKIPSLLLISTSQQFTSRQTWGAFALWASSCCLFMGMTMEAIELLKAHEIGSPMSLDVYKWGMHICAMYSFCTIMNVSSQEVYRRARILLCIACPMGSVVAFWQLSILKMSYDEVVDRDTFFVICLVWLRGLSGIGQTIGLKMLSHIEPIQVVDSVSRKQSNASVSSGVNTSVDLERAWSVARSTLFLFYLPCTIAYVFFIAVVGNCSQPMISITIPPSSCDVRMNVVTLVQNWPGIGIAFHFGLLTLLFASDGISALPSYGPSLAIGSLFAGHLGLMVAADFGWTFFQTPIAVTMSSQIVHLLKLSLLLVWMVSSFTLHVTLHRLWKIRVIPL